MIAVRKKHVFYLLFIVHILGLIIYYNFGKLRDIAYALPIGALFFYLLSILHNRQLKLKKDFHIFLWKKYFIAFFFFFYVVLVQSILAYTIANDFNSRLVREAVFLIFPLISVAIITYFLDKNQLDFYTKILFFGVIVAFVLEKGVSNVFSLQFDLVESLIYSQFSSESGLAFLIGLFTFYFIFSKQKVFALISIFFMFASGKRTVLAAFIPCILLYFFLQVFRVNVNKYKLPIAAVALIVNAFVIYFIYLLVTGEFDESIITYTGLPPNSFTKGRYNLWLLIYNRFGFDFLGSGLGSISNFLVGDLNYPLHNPLNDVLKICVEHGFIVFILWFLTFYYVNSRTNSGFVMSIYGNILFLTTNVLIYFFFMFCFYFLQTAFIGRMYQSNKHSSHHQQIEKKHVQT